MECDIIIPVWNQLEFTRDCIENLIKNTRIPYTLIVIDNASDDDTKRYLEGLKTRGSLRVELIRNEVNAGFIKAVNQGLRISHAAFVCILNNDTIPAPGWLERMIEFAATHRDVGLVNPQCSGHGDMPIDMYAKKLEDSRGAYMEMNQCQGFCMLVKREVIAMVGYLDESFGIGGFDDTDYSMRAYLAGYKCVAIKDAYVYHRLHGSFDRAGDREAWVERNQKIYYEKWGKHLRAGIAVSLRAPDDEALAHLATFSYGLAREWSWVHIWLNCRADQDEMQKAFEGSFDRYNLPPHQNIRVEYFNLPQPAFDLVVSGKLLERIRPRMKEKRFDMLVAFGDFGIDAFRAASLSAKVTKVRTMTISHREKVLNWLNKGKETALFTRQKVRESEQHAV